MSVNISLKSATLYLTDVCNSRCRSCNIWKNTTGTWLPKRQWIHAIQQLADAGIRHINFCGGEPLLREDLPVLVEEASHAGFSEIEIYTNGLLLTSEKIRRFVGAGANKFTLSVDGIGTTHDTFRGIPGAFDKCMEVLSHLAAEPVVIAVATNLHRNLVDELIDLIRIVDGYGAMWFPNILNDQQYYFKGIEKAALGPHMDQLPRIVEAVEKQISTGKNVGIRKEHLPFIESALTGNSFSDMACVVGLSCVYLDATQKVYSGCTVLPPVGDLTLSSMSEILEEKQYDRQVGKMLRRQCPGCTCSFYMNVDNYLENGKQRGN